MNSGDPLDDWLSSQHAKVHRKPKLLLEVVREAYPIGVPALIIKSQTDRLAIAGGYSFHLGTPDEVLRRICSWLLTNEQEGVLKKFIAELWRRHGREDVALSALLLANLHTIDDDDAWGILADVVGEYEPAEALLLVIEELFRAKRKPPKDSVLIALYGQKLLHSYLALLVQHATWIRSGRPQLEKKWIDIIESVQCTDGDSLITRVRDQMLQD